MPRPSVRRLLAALPLLAALGCGSVPAATTGPGPLPEATPTPVVVAAATPEPTPTAPTAPSTPVVVPADAHAAEIARAEVLRKAGKRAEALAVADGILRREPGHVPALVVRGKALEGLGRHADSAAAFTEAIRRDPACVGAHRGRSVLRHKTDDHRGALVDADAWVRLDPKNFEAHWQRGSVLFRLERDVEADASLTTALTFNPDCVGALHTRARVRAWLKQFDRSLADAEAVLKTLPADPRMLGVKGECLLRLGKGKDAVAPLTAAVAALPNEIALYRLRAEAHAAAGDPARAAADRAEVARRSGPANASPVGGGMSAQELAAAAHYDAMNRMRDQQTRTRLNNAGLQGAMGLPPR